MSQIPLKEGVYQARERFVATLLTEDMAWAYLLDGAPLPTGFRFSGATYHEGDRTIQHFRVRTDGQTPNGCTGLAGIGDWLVLDGGGRPFTCDAETFAATYEPAATVISDGNSAKDRHIAKLERIIAAYEEQAGGEAP